MTSGGASSSTGAVRGQAEVRLPQRVNRSRIAHARELFQFLGSGRQAVGGEVEESSCKRCSVRRKEAIGVVEDLKLRRGQATGGFEQLHGFSVFRSRDRAGRRH